MLAAGLATASGRTGGAISLAGGDSKEGQGGRVAFKAGAGAEGAIGAEVRRVCT